MITNKNKKPCNQTHNTHPEGRGEGSREGNREAEESVVGTHGGRNRLSADRRVEVHRGVGGASAGKEGEREGQKAAQRV